MLSFIKKIAITTLNPDSYYIPHKKEREFGRIDLGA